MNVLTINIKKHKVFCVISLTLAGTGGFVNVTMNYVWEDIDSKKLEEVAKVEEKKEYAMTQLYGIEKDDFLAKISKSYMAVLGDGKSGIFIEDSLNKKYWSDIAKANIRDGYFDYILTNPPFGKDVDVQKETKDLYTFDSVDVIFLERALQLLKDDGILGIILPETIFHSSSNRNVRDEFFYAHNIKCMIDLPHDTFRPYNNAKCDIIFIEKNKKQQDKILAIKIDNIGHNHLGETTFKYDIKSNTFDENAVNEDITGIIELLKDEKYMDIKKQQVNSSLLEEGKQYIQSKKFNDNIKFVNSEAVLNSDLLVARNYFDEIENIDNSISIDELIEKGIISYFDGHGSPKGYLKGLGEYPYVRVKDIINLEVYINPLDLIPKFEYDRLYSENKKLRAKDIAFVRRGSYRIGDVGILYKKDINSIFTREILILRVREGDNEYFITPYNLLFLLNSKIVKRQLANKIMIDTTLPNIGDRWKNLKIPIYSENEMKRISNEMEKLYNTRAKFWKKLDDIEPNLFKVGENY